MVQKTKVQAARGSTLPSREGTGRALSPAFVARQFKPGQSGNPTGNKGTAYGDVVRLARDHCLRAVERLVELMESPDERIALLAAQALLDRGYGKPREHIDQLPANASQAEERRRMIVATLVANLDAQAAAMHAAVEQPTKCGAVPVLSSQAPRLPKFS